MNYLMGDVQGCCDALDRLLAEIDFSPSRDHLVLVGDLVNRGPDSLATLKRLRGLGDAATCLLGNHDLHLLAVAHGVRKPRKDDTLDDILDSKERDGWLDWLRQRRMAQCIARLAAGACRRGAAMGRAPPRWRWPARSKRCCAGPTCRHAAADVRQRAGAVERRAAGRRALALRHQRADAHPLLHARRPARAEEQGRRRRGAARLPAVVRHPRPAHARHADRLRPLVHARPIDRPDLLALDTGCVWGGALTAVRIDGGRREMVQVRCEQAQLPG